MVPTAPFFSPATAQVLTAYPPFLTASPSTTCRSNSPTRTRPHSPYRCMLTINDFGSGHRSSTGNRKGAGKERGAKKNEAPNLFAFKNKLLFDRESLPEEAPRGTVGTSLAEHVREPSILYTTVGLRSFCPDQTTTARRTTRYRARL